MKTFGASHRVLLSLIDGVMSRSGFECSNADDYSARFVQKTAITTCCLPITIIAEPWEEKSVFISASCGFVTLFERLNVRYGGVVKDTVSRVRGLVDSAKVGVVDLINAKHQDQPLVIHMWANLSYDPISDRLDVSRWHFFPIPSADVSGEDHARAMAFSMALKACASFGDAVPSKRDCEDGDTGFICYTSDRPPEAFKPVMRSEFRIKTH